jgi:V8-like Glu-specific endopeptidase
MNLRLQSKTSTRESQVFVDVLSWDENSFDAFMPPNFSSISNFSFESSSGTEIEISAPTTSSVIVNPSAYPYDCVCYISSTFSIAGDFRGSGVIIGPHTILTASHVVWHTQTNESASAVSVHPGDSTGPNGATITGQYVFTFWRDCLRTLAPL